MIIAGIRTLLSEHPKIRNDFAVRFARFADSALEISILYGVVPPGDFFDVVSEMNLAIKRLCEREGYEMAFPSMTLYRGDAAVPEVGAPELGASMAGALESPRAAS